MQLPQVCYGDQQKIFSDDSKANTWPNSGTFSTRFKVDFGVPKLWQSPNILKKYQNLVECLPLSRPKKFSVGLHSILVVLAYFFRITAIHRNKQQGRTTLRSIFIGVDVSCERFNPIQSRSPSILGLPNFDKVPTSSKSTSIWSSVCLWLVRKKFCWSLWYTCGTCTLL